jgi:hypothetical protein
MHFAIDNNFGDKVHDLGDLAVYTTRHFSLNTELLIHEDGPVAIAYQVDYLIELFQYSQRHLDNVIECAFSTVHVVHHKFRSIRRPCKGYSGIRASVLHAELRISRNIPGAIPNPDSRLSLIPKQITQPELSILVHT